ncbi:hypothetical protein [Candidatus Chrysopegis kryptomonas]|uniref:Translation initiation factor 2B subunit, eIF-2B alpha/beta/delta family n=1 Tax=Candidatus Chryseopegocella kryptomonas TaxID=1633643 RepID=A0A0P1MZN5_9BACT|nr:hypothetical protein [Candidatus Chrysopegis kryptomonas]CUT01478.1 Translation initiation factor 2B subunit, eIF-2B alpha/beta/delta family [Candidatus Chrysopegis kryptomonas]
MRNHKIEDKLREILQDKTSGASILSQKLIEVIKTKSLQTKSEKEFSTFLKKLQNDLKDNHPLLFQLHNVVYLIQKSLKSGGIKVALTEIEKIEQGLNISIQKITENFLKWLNLKSIKKFSTATLSYSGTVLNVLKNVRSKIHKVYIFRSCPNCEGETMAEKLAENGINVYLVNDFAIDYVLNNVDFVLSGCDAIFEDGKILNKAGTSSVFKLAKLSDKDTIVLADFLKITHLKFDYKKLARNAFTIKRKEKLTNLDLIFELVSAEFISNYITDFGIFTNQNLNSNEIIHPTSKMFGLR